MTLHRERSTAAPPMRGISPAQMIADVTCWDDREIAETCVRGVRPASRSSGERNGTATREHRAPEIR